MIVFGSLRGNKEPHEILVNWLKEHNPALIEFQFFGETKNHRYNSRTFVFEKNYTSFIMGEKFCEPVRLFINMKKRAEIKCKRLFLYSPNGVEFKDSCWFTEKPVGEKKLATLVSSNSDALIESGVILPGVYTNKSLRQTAINRFIQAEAPEIIIASAIHHLNGKVVSQFPNVHAYSEGVKEVATRYKLAYLLFDTDVTWGDIRNTDNFITYFKQAVPYNTLPHVIPPSQPQPPQPQHNRPKSIPAAQNSSPATYIAPQTPNKKRILPFPQTCPTPKKQVHMSTFPQHTSPPISTPSIPSQISQLLGSQPKYDFSFNKLKALQKQALLEKTKNLKSTPSNIERKKNRALQIKKLKKTS